MFNARRKNGIITLRGIACSPPPPSAISVTEIFLTLEFTRILVSRPPSGWSPVQTYPLQPEEGTFAFVFCPTRYNEDCMVSIVDIEPLTVPLWLCFLFWSAV